jgi:aminoglycoside/choline kinase family phosphotransferase
VGTEAPPGLEEWVRQVACSRRSGALQLTTLAGDASHRRYYRVLGADRPLVAVHAPPQTEKNREFLLVRTLFARAGVRVPAVLASDIERGLLLLDDLGDRLLLEELDRSSAERRYPQALAILSRLAGIDTADCGCPDYDRTLLEEELGRFATWFAGRLLGVDPAPAAGMLDAFFDLLVENALAQPRVLVHRDFHSRNLMIQADDALAVIDFQDAVVGPITYDLVSLLRDCYIRWPAQQVQAWALAHRATLCREGRLAACPPAQCMRWFDLMGLQRHIKVLGTFARLYLRDGKSGYLDDLPLVLRYVRETVQRYAGEEPALAGFQRWFDEALQPLIERADWGRQR